MGEATERLLDLRPVVFRYKQHVETHGDAGYGILVARVATASPPTSQLA